MPLYPDDSVNVFNEEFLNESENVLSSFLPDAKKLQSVIRVIDIPATADGQVMQVLMNGETNRAVAMLTTVKQNYSITSEKQM